MKFENLKKNKLIILVFILSSIIPLIIAVGNIYEGRIAFWYDPARDFLLALQNLKNPTLIGQPTGLPGLFYGPYWIWTISLLTLISKDPKIISFFLLTVPYFTIFPFVLYKIAKNWGFFIFISLWLLFILNFGSYSNQIWNVHYAALFLLFAVYFFINPNNNTSENNRNYILSGLFIGLVANFHLSFGIPSIVATLISIIIVHLFENYKKLKLSFTDLIKKISLFISGILVAFSPFILFEIRHEFIQSKTFIKAITNSIVYNTASVGQTGMTDEEIIKSFFGKFSDLLGISSEYLNLVLIFIFISIIIVARIKKIILTLSEKRLLVLIFCISFFLNASFIFNENPTWGYYFIGVELLFLLLIGLLLSKLAFGRYIVILFISFSLLLHTGDLKKSFEKNDYSNSDLGTRSHIVKNIFEDAEEDFQYYAYSSAIYTYEYDYLFLWNDEKYNENINKDSNLIYLIIPKVDQSIKEDFINYKAPKSLYSQIKEWKIPDGTTVYKMIKK